MSFSLIRIRAAAYGLRGRAGLVLLGSLICLVFLSCGGGAQKGQDSSGVPATKPAPAHSKDQVHWTFEPDAIELRVYARNNLNTYNGYPHATMLCLYQLKKPGAFQKRASSKSGIRELLQCQSFDPSVAQSHRMFIQPGQNRTKMLDRAEKARHVGVAAGYSALVPGHVTRLYHIPIQNKESGMFWWSQNNYTPGKLTMQLLFGAHSIQRVGER